MRLLTLFVGAALSLALPAQAANIAGLPHGHETLINSSFGSTANVSIGGGERVEIGVGYLYSVIDLLQVGGVVGAGYAGSEFLNVMALANLNFAMGSDGKHSLFVGGGVGWDNVTKGARQFAWRADVGTRCQIFDHLYWRPTIGVQDRGAGVKFVAEFLSLSLTY